MSGSFVLALDQGTTSSRAIVFDREGSVRGMSMREFMQHYPRPGWVEHDPGEIWSSQLEVMQAAVTGCGLAPEDIAAIGITNQRETTVVWDRATGRPIHNAIVWQCRRTSAMCDELVREGHAPAIGERTGLVVDPYFSGTKLAWLLDNVSGARRRAEAGELAFGTVDSWLLWNLTGGAVHATDVTNAARTMLFNIHSLGWDDGILGLLRIPRSILPVVLPSSGIMGETAPAVLGQRPVPISGIAGDQHAALFGQACLSAGMVKNTYGTGCFLLMNTGDRPVASANRLLTTPAWSLEPGRATYAIEGSVFIAGAAVQWLRDAVHLIGAAAESEEIARAVPDSGGVYLVPAFAGLGAPHWDSYARGAFFGLTSGSTRNHLVRAALESIAYQSRDVVLAMAADRPLSRLRADGGASANDFLMQFQADILGIPVERPVIRETTALGAAFLAGLATGYWAGTSEIERCWKLDRRFEPSMSSDRRESLCAGWRKAVDRAKGWALDG